MNNEFFEALGLLAEENNIEMETLIERIKDGIMRAIKKEYPDTENVLIDINSEKGKFEMKLIKTVVEGEPLDPANEINIDEAQAITKRARVGGTVEIKLNSAKFGRVAAQQAKQQIKHDIKEFEKERLLAQYEDKVHECVSATVQKVEPNTLNAVLTIDKNEVYLVRGEQIPNEVLVPGDIVKVYVCGIANPERKPSIKISRKHKDLVKRLFELEIPEIYDGTVEVKSIAREAGSRTKIAGIAKTLTWTQSVLVSALSVLEFHELLKNLRVKKSTSLFGARTRLSLSAELCRRRRLRASKLQAMTLKLAEW